MAANKGEMRKPGWFQMICTTVKIGCFSVFHAEHNWFGLSRDGLEETVETETERRKRGGRSKRGRTTQKMRQKNRDWKKGGEEEEMCRQVLNDRGRVNRCEVERRVTAEERRGGGVTRSSTTKLNWGPVEEKGDTSNLISRRRKKGKR